MRKFAIGLAIAAVTLLSGCSTRYLVTSEHYAGITETAPDVVGTPTYIKERDKLKTVAVKAPTSCSSKSVSELTGESRSQSSVLSTACGVEIAELERELAKRGYRVISWDMLNQYMTSNNMKDRDAASALGAQMLFQINSLEQTIVHPGADARWTRSYYKSNRYGDKVKPAILSQVSRSALSRYIAPKEMTVKTDRPAVTMDAKAIHLGNGEAFWFYRWTHVETKAAADAVQVLLICKNPQVCAENEPATSRRAGRDEKTSSDSVGVSTQQQSASVVQAQYHKLMVELVSDMVKNFAGK